MAVGREEERNRAERIKRKRTERRRSRDVRVRTTSAGPEDDQLKHAAVFFYHFSPRTELRPFPRVIIPRLDGSSVRLTKSYVVNIIVPDA